MEVVIHSMDHLTKERADQPQIARDVSDMVSPVHSMEIAGHDILIPHKTRVESDESALWLEGSLDPRHHLSGDGIAHVMEEAEGHHDIERLIRPEIDLGDVPEDEGTPVPVAFLRRPDIRLVQVDAHVPDIREMLQHGSRSAAEIEDAG